MLPINLIVNFTDRYVLDEWVMTTSMNEYIAVLFTRTKNVRQKYLYLVYDLVTVWFLLVVKVHGYKHNN